jgi:hypothetical protein
LSVASKIIRRVRWRFYDSRAGAALVAKFAQAEAACKNFDALPAADLGLATIAFNNPTVIAMQIRLFRQFLVDDHVLVVADNSPDRAAQERIRELCDAEGVAYVRLPKNPWTGVDPARSHGLALNWVHANVHKRHDWPYFGFLDHDVFPVRKTSLLPHLRQRPFYGLRQEGRKGCWYLWPGFVFFTRSLVDVETIDLRPSEYGDTGSSLWVSLLSKIGTSEFRGVTQTLGRLRDGSEAAQDSLYAKLDDDWIHTLNASYWMKVAPKEADVERLLAELTAAPADGHTAS